MTDPGGVDREVEAAVQRVFHWILTLQWGRGGTDLVNDSQSGTVNLGPGATRTQVLKKLREHAGVPRGFTGPGVVLFFSLEPESMGGYFGESPAPAQMEER